MTVARENLLPAFWHGDLDDLGLSKYARRLAASLRRKASPGDPYVIPNFNGWKKELRMGHAALMQAITELHNVALIEIVDLGDDDIVYEVTGKLVDKCFIAREVDEMGLGVDEISIYLRVARRVSRPKPGVYGSCFESLANISKAATATVGKTISGTGKVRGDSVTGKRLQALERTGLIWRDERRSRTTHYRCRTNRQWRQWKKEMAAAKHLEEVGLLVRQEEEPTSTQHFGVRTKDAWVARKDPEQAPESVDSASVDPLRDSPENGVVSPESGVVSPEYGVVSPENWAISPEGGVKVNPSKINPSEVNPPEVNPHKGTAASPPGAAGPASPRGSASPTTPGGSPALHARSASTPGSPSAIAIERDSPADKRDMFRATSGEYPAYSLKDARELEDPQERFWAIYEVRVRDEFGLGFDVQRKVKRQVAEMFDKWGDDFMLEALDWFFDNWEDLQIADPGLYRDEPFPPTRIFYSEYHLHPNREFIYGEYRISEKRIFFGRGMTLGGLAKGRWFSGGRGGAKSKRNRKRDAGPRTGPLYADDEELFASDSKKHRPSLSDRPSLDADLETRSAAPIRSAVEAYNAHRGGELPEATSLRSDTKQRLRALVEKHGEEAALEIVRDRTRDAAERRDSFVRIHGLKFLVRQLDNDLSAAA